MLPNSENYSAKEIMFYPRVIFNQADQYNIVFADFISDGNIPYEKNFVGDTWFLKEVRYKKTKINLKKTITY